MLNLISSFCKAGLAGVLLLPIAGLSGTSLAQEPDASSLHEKSPPRASVDDIARQINQQPQWRILSAEPLVENQKTMYRFKVLNKNRGRVEVIIIDPDQPELEQFN
jgi:hypothetical protein